MKSESVEKWVWVLIYGGMGLAMLGIWAWDGEAAIAYALGGLGGLMIATGVVFIYVRSRMGKRGAAPGAPR